MRPDVLDLKDFYAEPLGRMAVRLIRVHVGHFWPADPAARTLSIGFGLPYLNATEGCSERTLAFMPERQGAIAWPAGGPNSALLGDEMALPFADATFDRLLIVHALEFVDHVRGLLSEAWRVLAASGHLILIAPNRASIWSRRDVTPFANGRPFSKGQLAAALRDSKLVPTDWHQALYMPPVRRRSLISAMPAVERIGRVVWRNLGGVHIVQAEKVIYAVRAKPERARAPRLGTVPAFGQPVSSITRPR